MASAVSLSFGGHTAIFSLMLLALLSILFFIFGYRQIRRLRNNSARREVNSAVAAEIPKDGRGSILKRIAAVESFRRAYIPTFDGCASHHANTPHIHRMLAMNEIGRDVDRRLISLSKELIRSPADESTYHYLHRIRKLLVIPEFNDDAITRLSFLHEWARRITEMPFEEEQLAEVRALLSTFTDILINKPQFLSVQFSNADQSHPLVAELQSRMSRSLDKNSPLESTRQRDAYKRTFTSSGSCHSENVPLLCSAEMNG